MLVIPHDQKAENHRTMLIFNGLLPHQRKCILLMLAMCACLAGCRAIGKIGESRQSVAARKLSRQGIQHMHEGQWDSAEQLFSDALAISDVDDRAHRGIAEAYWNRGQKDAAIKHMERAVELSAKDPRLVGRLGEMYLDVGRESDAELQSVIALETERESADIWALQGDCLRRRGLTHQALAAYHRALALQPNHVDVKLRVAEIYLTNSQYDRLLSTLDRFADSGDDRSTPARVHMLRGIAMRNLGRDEQAGKHFARALDRDPDQAEPHLQLAAIDLAANRPGMASERVSAAMKINPDLVQSSGWSAYLMDPKQRIAVIPSSAKLPTPQTEHSGATQVGKAEIGL